MNESRKLLDAWLPPDNAGQPIACLTTTFTFDPDFFEGDCLSRFLGLSWKRGEGEDLAFLIDQEERLAEVRATVVVDRSLNPEGRSLRWDVLPVGLRGGVQHAKVTLLVWDRLVRVIVSSANLTTSAYRSNAEIAAVLDACEGSELPVPLFSDLLEGLGRLVNQSPAEGGRQGPKQRALETLRDAGQRISSFGLPERGPGDLRVSAVFCEPGRPALQQLDAVWRGGPARYAMVLSPFFDAEDGAQETVAGLMGRLAQRGDVALDFVVPVNTALGKTVVQAPAVLRSAAPNRAKVAFYTFKEESEDQRHLHAKAVLLENDEWAALLVGSSNFTQAGLGINATRGNLEANLAFGVPAKSREARAFRKLFGVGESFDPATVEWEPLADDDTALGPALPWGFVGCLFEPGTNPALLVRLESGELPKAWRIEWPVGHKLLTSESWQASGAPAEARCPVTIKDAPPFVVEVHWEAGDSWAKAGWPVNVTEPGKLAPPEKLRNLPVEALIKALASTRPLPEAVADAIRRDSQAKDRATAAELDPLRRYSQTGQLLQRARRLAFALSGLQRRLEKPTSNVDALVWRLEGPFGPKALGEGLARESAVGGLLLGELDFLLAEIALTVKRVNWPAAAIGAASGAVADLVQAVIRSLDSLRKGVGLAPELRDYVEAAFREARS